jgi:hypothetical protein
VSFPPDRLPTRPKHGTDMLQASPGLFSIRLGFAFAGPKATDHGPTHLALAKSVGITNGVQNAQHASEDNI